MTLVPPGGAMPGGAGAPEGGPPTALVAELASLLRDCAEGDEAAFARVYDLTSHRLFGLVLRVVRDRAQAEEVTQDAYLDIWRSCPRFDASMGSALSWMLTIAHRKAVDRVRSAEAQSRRDTAYEAREQAIPYDVTVEDAHRNLDAQRVRNALTSLTETQRGALELAYFGGYTHREVASILNLPIGTAKTRIRDGLIRLRDNLGMQR
ncbi:MAG TPA: ECF RNA polymerase sigma factor SigK [Dermatophilaceae bacterium]|nr:ECF RNA polymerase sigma factor SigK [Dermatophilaceae bacterium]